MHSRATASTRLREELAWLVKLSTKKTTAITISTAPKMVTFFLLLSIISLETCMLKL